MSSIDDIQDRIESMTEALFEAVRSHADKNPENRMNMQSAVKNEFKAAITAIDNLAGADRTASEQEDELNELSAKNTALQAEVALLQEQLQNLDTACTEELSEILNDPSCRCERS
jgi:prefoldin subunit 5